MKVVITGGHLSPALSVIQALPRDAEVIFAGRKYGLEGDKALTLEYKMVKDLNVEFVDIKTGRFQRTFTRRAIPSFFKFPGGLYSSHLLLKKFRPDVVLGFGGYVSFPVCLAAFMLGIPVVIHEQTLEAGFSNKIISKWARKICISWESSRIYFPSNKVVFTGNPLREEILNSKLETRSTAQGSKLPIIYITGGSLGSHFINTLVEGCIKTLLTKFIIIHQTGDSREFNDFERLEELKKTLPQDLRERYILKKIVDNFEIGPTLSSASLVIGRAGINTVTELIFLKKPALLIPLPISQNNEQVKNALFIKNLGLAEFLYQDRLTSSILLKKINDMMGNIASYKINNSQALINKNAAKEILAVVKDVSQKKKKR